MRKKWLSRALAAMLAGVLTVGLLAGCGAEEKKEESSAPAASSSAPAAESSAPAEEKYEVSYPMTGFEDVELRVYIGGGQPLSSTQTDYKDVPFWAGFEERTGIKCVWEYAVAGADATAAYNLMLTEEDLPHIVIGYYTNTANQADLLADGIVFPIDEYIEEYAPDFYAFLQTEQAQTAARLFKVEGQLTSFPSFRSSAWGCTYSGPLVRQDWLDAQGLKAPTTPEEMENVLNVFKEKYNAFLSFTSGNAFMSGWDAQAGWADMGYYIDANDEVQVGGIEDETKAYVTSLAKWYKEGLLDPNFLTADNAYFKQVAVEEKMGMVWNAISQQTEYINGAKAAGLDADWVGFENLVGKDGIAHWIQTEYSTYTGSFGAYITNACDTEEELKAAMAWINYAYTEEGKMYWNFGIEGESYEMVDGKAAFTEKVTKDERGMTQALRDWTGASAMPVGIQLEEFVRAKNNPACGESVDKWVSNQDAAKYKVPGLPLTADEKTAKTDIDTAVNTYVKEQCLKFITGQRSLDEWDAYLGELKAMGYEDALKIARDAYARFKAL